MAPLRLLLSFILLLCAKGVICQTPSQNQVYLTLQSGHTTPIRKFLVTPDGNYLFSTDGKNVVMWSLKAKKQYASFVPPSGSNVADIAISKDGKLLAVGSEKEILLYDIGAEKFLPEIKAPGIGLAFSPVKNQLVYVSKKTDAGTELPQINVYDLATKQSVKQIQTSHYEAGPSVHLVFSPDGTKIILGSGKKYSVTDIATGKVVNAAWANNDIRGILVSGINKKMAILSFTIGQGTMEVYDINTFAPSYTKAVEDASESFALTPDQKNVLTVGIDHATLFDLPTGNVINEYELKGHGTAVSFSSDGTQIYLGRKQAEGVNAIGTLEFLDRNFNVQQAVSTEVSMVESVAMHPAKAEMVFADWSGHVKVFDLATGKLKKRRIGSGKMETIPGELAYSPDGKYLAVGSKNRNQFEVWDMKNAAVVARLAGPSYAADIKSQYVSFIRSGKNTYVMAEGQEGSRGTWDVNTWKVNSGYPNTGEQRGRYGHPATEHIFKIRTDGVFIEQYPNEKSVAHFAVKNLNDFALSADGRFAAATGREGLFIYDAINYATIKSFPIKDCGVLAFSNDGNYLAVANKSAIEIFETKSLTSLNKIIGHYGDIKAIAFSFDSQIMLTGSDDGTCKLWNFRAGNEIATIVGFGGDDYAIVTPDNYYLSSKGAFRGAMFRAKGKMFPLDQFDLKFNRPDIVLSRIGYAPPELVNSYNLAYKKRMKKLGITEEMRTVDLNLPELELTQSPPSTTAEHSINLSLNARDKIYKLHKLHIYVNGSPLPNSAGIDLKAAMSATYSGTHTVDLERGKNIIELSVVNEKGVSSLKQSFEVNCTGEQDAPETYLLAIGVSSFQQSNFNLTYAAKDAQDLEVLVKERGHGLGNKFTKVITDSGVTRETILDTKAWLSKARIQDRVIIFIATHGLLDGELNYFLATHDTDFNDPAKRGIVYADFEGLVDGIAAREKLILIDACHSGEIDNEETEVTASSTASVASNVKARGFKNVSGKSVGLENSFEIMKDLFADFNRGTGAIVISAASGKEFAYEAGAQKNGIFTYAIQEGLISGKADINHDREIKVSELREYVGNRVEQLTEGKQHPTSRGGNLEFDFKIW